jgi:hypothetical protein
MLPEQTRVSVRVTFAESGVTITVIVSVPWQPVGLVAVTIYVVVPTGLAVGFEQLLHVKFVDGDHEYVLPPDTPVTVIKVEPLWQMLTSGPAFNAKAEVIVTVEVAVLLHPFPSVPITV